MIPDRLLGNIIYSDYPDVQRDWHEREKRDDITNILRNNRIETVSPDLYHVSSLFEGESIFGRAPSFTQLPKRPVLRSATLYDFIPHLFASQYITNWQYSTWYKRMLSVAQKLDVGLAISETTKSDAKEILKARDQTIVNILGGVDDCFRILPQHERQRSPVWKRLELRGPYVLYVGGPDPRKNVDGALRAFAEMRQRIKGSWKLVLVYDVSDSEIQAIYAAAQQLGIRAHVIIAGFVTDHELVELYNSCDLFISPSLYEGLGLPIIEAMRCGAPVLVGDNSSQREIVDREEYRFDTSSTSDMAAKIAAALASPGMRSAMRAYAAERCGAFSWERSARIALDAWEGAYAARTRRELSASFSMPRSNPAHMARPRPRIAMFTPLPDMATGIADYAADFVPFLKRYADLDLFVEDITAVRFHDPDVAIRHHHDIVSSIHTYDVVVYQLGNSPFHHYMLPYIQRYPGVIVLHDAYLGHLTHDPNSPADFIAQAIRDHGGLARAIVQASDTLAESASRLIAELSCSPTHVHRSIGVIVHSQFARGLLYADSNAAISAEIAVCPQYVAPIAEARRCDRATARRRLGLPPDTIILASFGHVTPTKGVLELIDGFRRSEIGRSGGAILVFVGNVEGGSFDATPFGRSVFAAVGGRNDVIVTNYVEFEKYELYLGAIDFGVQLRKITRGETSRAMLTLLVNGIPFIHNRLGSSTEIPDSVAIALDSLEPDAMAGAIDRLANDHDLRREMAAAAQDYTQAYLGGESIAERFVRTATQMADRARCCHPTAVAAEIARAVRGTSFDVDLPREAAAAFVNQEGAEERSRMLIDVTHIREQDHQTGVQRVVREFTRAAYVSDDRTREAQSFAFSADGLLFADDYAQVSGARCEAERSSQRSGSLALKPFDRILMADGTWHLSDWMRAPLERLNALGGSAFALIHDILPLQRPDLFEDHVTTSMVNWLRLVTEHCDGLICTSMVVSQELIDHLAAHEEIPIKPGLRIGWTHLGSNPLKPAPEADGIGFMHPAIEACRSFYLVVGMIEPRKGHRDILDAFDKIWAADLDATLVFVGRRGWSIDELAARMDAHPERNKRFIELGFVDDAELLQLYTKATAVIMGSVVEGFGLPIFEAAHVGTPLILSDLPVFRELGGDNARYFTRGSANDLFEMVSQSIRSPMFLLGSRPIMPPTWDQCYARVERFMNGLDTYHRF